MKHTGLLLALLALAVPTTTGCAATYGQGTAVYHARVPTHHDGRRGYYRQIERDVRAYVYRLDRHLRLNRRQERRLHQLLTDRTYRLLERARYADHRRVYPFPRSFHHRSGYRTERWWNAVDRDVEALLNHRQRREYRSLTGRDDRRPNRRRGRRY